eukprot:scaffold919_cov153-Ochromonas_danica.AAC.4
MEEELSPGSIVEHKVKLLLCLKGIVQSYDKWMVDAAQNASLCFCMLDLLAFYDVGFGEHLHCIETAVTLLADQCDLAKRALSNDFDQLEVLQADLHRGLRLRRIHYFWINAHKRLWWPICIFCEKFAVVGMSRAPNPPCAGARSPPRRFPEEETGVDEECMPTAARRGGGIPGVSWEVTQVRKSLPTAECR